MMEVKNVHAALTASEWLRIAELTKQPREDLEKRWEAFLSEHPQHLRKIEVTEGETTKTADDCLKKEFSISIFSVLGIKLNVVFCGTSLDWSLEVRLALLLFGTEVWVTGYTLTPSNASICFSPDLVLVKAKFCIGVSGSKVCLRVWGDACYWGWGWHCADFDETLVCFG